MKAATVKQLKDELKEKQPHELLEICLHLSKFKKENKELLTYLLFEAQDEASFILSVKDEIDTSFDEINISRNFYYTKKSIRKVLKDIKKYIRYSKKKETEVELLLHFCKCLKNIMKTLRRSKVLTGIYDRQLEMATKRIKLLHEDLQYDYNQEVASLSQV